MFGRRGFFGRIGAFFGASTAVPELIGDPGKVGDPGKDKPVILLYDVTRIELQSLHNGPLLDWLRDHRIDAILIPAFLPVDTCPLHVWSMENLPEPNAQDIRELIALLRKPDADC